MAAASVALALAVLAFGQADSPPARPQRYTPASHTFYCDVPVGWHPFEDEDGFAVHLIGPDNPAGTYRTGVDVRWVERGQPGWVPQKKLVDDMRRSDSVTERSATSVRPMRIAGILARIFEVSETRWLPADQLPAVAEPLHHYVAVIPSGESYYLINLSSSRDVYLDFRNMFVDFLKSFKPLGYK